MKAKMKMKRAVWCLLGILSAGIFGITGIPALHSEAAGSSTVSITVGYWGGKEYTKKIVSMDELEANCGTNQVIYTWIDNLPAAGTTEAEGVYLRDVMDYAGIDMSSVLYYNFYTTDAGSYDGAWEQWSNDQLFGTRYSFASCFQQAVDDYLADPEDYRANPEAHYKVSDFIQDSDKRGEVEYLQEAWDNRESVEPMLMLKGHSMRWNGDGIASYLDFTEMKSEERPCLMFGQKSRTDTGRSKMAKLVEKIHIWFDGYPTITSNSADLEGEIGSKQQVTATVQSPDEFLSQEIAKDLEWVSSDKDVAVVDADGNVTIVGEGTAKISAKYNGKAYFSVGVSGTGNGTEDGDGSGTGDGSGDGDGSGTGDGSGDGDGSGTGDGSGDGDGSGTGDGSEAGDGSGTGDGSEAGDGSETGDGSEAGDGSETGDGSTDEDLNHNENNEDSGTDSETDTEIKDQQVQGDNADNSDKSSLQKKDQITYDIQKKDSRLALESFKQVRGQLAKAEDASLGDEPAGQAASVSEQAAGGSSAEKGHGSNRVKVYEMSEEVRQLPMIEEANSMTAGIGVAAVLLFGIGAVSEGIWFSGQKKDGKIKKD
ncbi:Bacterial Ig-like domain (group 2) [uncultured Roseburia sp.]|uniref:Ig-like domain-containing protein n=1 Tax=Brotonthovivens ammoniilytica TaxID=2981725 RepID=A0ABT2TPA0_9FIRM|nr:Ig-like domain-containing protein [Brotonthovivens ammoniilytica]MCU6763289.1 Ig-like domain-containing protein [Brotonthovivens ammoniilytica]SCJ12157.1 Bacterial Ig-like domain (group 2) [uncultured Roseburia sp.]